MTLSDARYPAVRGSDPAALSARSWPGLEPGTRAHLLDIGKDELVSDGLGDRVGAVEAAKLVLGTLQVNADHALGNAQDGGNILARLADGAPGQAFAFARRQFGGIVRGLGARNEHRLGMNDMRQDLEVAHVYFLCLPPFDIGQVRGDVEQSCLALRSSDRKGEALATYAELR